MDDDIVADIVVTRTYKISRKIAEVLSAQNADPEELVKEAAGNDRLYPIKNSGYAAHLMTYDAVIIAYAAEEPIQDIVNRYSDEALKRDDPGEYLTHKLLGIEEMIPEFSDKNRISEYSSRAHDFIESHLEYILPRRCSLKIKILWEQPDGSYLEKRPEM